MLSTRLLLLEYYIIISQTIPSFYVIIYPTPNDHYNTVLCFSVSLCVLFTRSCKLRVVPILSINQIKMQNDE